jgi:choice-of-anchor B domain-containing protein
MKRIYLVVIFMLFTSVEWCQQSSNVTLLSSLNPYPDSRYNDCWGYTDTAGREYALLGWEHGTSIIEISDPTQPIERAFIPGPDSRWRDIKTHSNYAYVVTEGTGPGEGLQIIDLSYLPDSAVLVNTVSDWFTSAHNLYIDNGFAYVVGTHGGGGMHILDLSDPVVPDRNSYYTESGYVHDVYVWDDTAYASAGATYDLIDLTDKANPQLISRSAALPGIYAHSGWLTEDKRYFIACEESNVRDIMVWDLQDRLIWNLVVPSFQSSGNTPVHNVFVRGDYAHVAYYADGYVVLDISDPLTPFIAGYYDTHPDTPASFAGVWGVYPFFPSGVVIASDINTGLYVFNFTGEDPTRVEEVTSAFPSDFILKQNYPNPFNPSTTIEFTINQASFVTLDIYNSMGEKVINLINGMREAGLYKVKFRSENLSSGVYIARLAAGGNAEVIKMSLLK